MCFKAILKEVHQKLVKYLLLISVSIILLVSYEILSTGQENRDRFQVPTLYLVILTVPFTPRRYAVYVRVRTVVLNALARYW